MASMLRNAAFRSARAATPFARSLPSRGMATEAQLKARIEAVEGIEKITSAMMMVSQAKLRGSQNFLAHVCQYHEKGAGQLLEDDTKAVEEEEVNTSAQKHLHVVVSADKGLCGALNSSLARYVRAEMASLGASRPQDENEFFFLGGKACTALKSGFADKFTSSLTDNGKFKQVSFRQCLQLADFVTANEFDKCTIYYQHFKSVIAYESRTIDLPTKAAMSTTTKFSGYEEEGPTDILDNMTEYLTASSIYFALSQTETSSLSARTTAMENSSKAAGEMIDDMRLVLNRTRQAKVTSELLEIISGASATDEAS